MVKFRKQILHSTLVISCIVISALFIGQFRILVHKFIIPQRKYRVFEVQRTFSEDTRNHSLSSSRSNIKQSGKVLELPSSEDLTFVDAKPFLLSTPDNDSILHVDPIQFIRDIKSPCFTLTKDFINVGNITISHAVEKGYNIRCLPYAYIAGFTKCATTNMFVKLNMHPLIKGGYKKKPTHSGNWTEYLSIKEVHFWDNMCLRPNSTMDYYSKHFSSDQIVESFNKYGTMPLEVESKGDDLRDLIYLDATPRTIWHGDTWDEDLFNIQLLEPNILLPHKLYHVQPNAKFIVSLRNPTDRLLSDFNYYYRGLKSPETFHRKVVDAIAWWNQCIQKMGTHQKACAYGKAPAGLPELGFEICMRNRTLTRKMRNFPYEIGSICQSINAWKKNVADRLRVSMYDLFIRDWLSIFPRENFLFIKFEEYSKEPVEYIDKYVLPFLELPPFSKFMKRRLSHIPLPSYPKIVISPETKGILDQFYKKNKVALANLLKDEAFLWDD